MKKPITKKYWLFYAIKNGKLWAYTETKKIAKMFESQRDMNEYRCIKKELSVGEITHLAITYENKALQVLSLKTRGDNNRIVNVDVAMTYRERSLLDAEISYMVFNPKCVMSDTLQGFLTTRHNLRPEFEQALRNLRAFHFIAIKEGEILFGIDDTIIQIDELEVFIRLWRYSQIMEE